MNQVLQTYINPKFQYVFTRGPDEVKSTEAALLNGINCISLAHLVIKDLFDYKLPSDLKSSELSKDTLHFNLVNSLDDMEIGDLVWFGVSNPIVELKDFKPKYRDKQLLNWRDFPIKHVAIYTGEKTEGDYLMLHSTSVDGTNVIWSLNKFKNYDKYQKIYFIKRFKYSLRQPNS